MDVKLQNVFITRPRKKLKYLQYYNNNNIVGFESEHSIIKSSTSKNVKNLLKLILKQKKVGIKFGSTI